MLRILSSKSESAKSDQKQDIHHIVARLRTALYETLAVSLREIEAIAGNPASCTRIDLGKHYDTLAAFYALRESVAAEYLDEVGANFETATLSHTTDGSNTANDPLAHHFEQSINTAEQRYKNSLKLLHAQLRHLGTQLPAGSLNPHCMDPRSIYLPYKVCLESLPISDEGKYILHQLFNEKLFSKLKELYRQANHIITDGDTTPDDNFPGQFISEPMTEEDLEPEYSPPTAKEIDSMSTGEFFAPVEIEAWAREAELRLAQEQNNHERDIELHHHHDISKIPYRHYSIDREELQNLLHVEFPTGDTNSTQHQRSQLIQALTVVQHAEANSDTPLNTEEIISAATCALYEAGSTVATGVIENEKKVIDFVTQTFNTMLGDDTLSNEVKGLLARLQLPIIKLALIDFAFFQDSAHPARQLLNQMANIGISNRTIKDTDFTSLKAATKLIVNDFETETDTFVTALKLIEPIHEEFTRKARELETKIRHQAQISAKRSAAKRTVISTLKHQMRGTRVPDILQRFTTKCWAYYMGLVYLEQGGKSKEWQAAVETVKQLIENAQSYTNFEQINRLTSSDATFFEDIRQKLEKTIPSHPEHQFLFEEIVNWYELRTEKLRMDWELQQQVALAATIEIPDESAAASTQEDEPASNSIADNKVVALFTDTEEKEQDDSTDNSIDDEAASAEEIQDVLIEKSANDVSEMISKAEIELDDLINSIPEEVRPNSWFEIYQGEGRARRRLKLSAILEDTGQLLFVDRTGRGILEIEIECFVDDYNEGRSKLLNDNNRFDSALSSVINNIKNKLP